MKGHSFITTDQALVASLYKPRLAGSHKGDHGHALLFAGSKGKMGAAVIAATACLRTGAGLLTVNVPEEERQVLQVAIPEAMLMMREGEHDLSPFRAIGIGPGMGLEISSEVFLKKIIQLQQPCIMDADALTILSRDKAMWQQLPAGTILTPHPGEFDRLFGKHSSINERNAKALELSLQYPWVIVLKGQHTQVNFRGNAWINTTGNAGLAKGGSGDALTGMILSLLAQGYEPVHAAIVAVFLHGKAADIALTGQSLESLLITDVIGCIGKAFEATFARS